ncbi:phosphoglycerate dehydrogenase [Aureococcus anophagefferens]|nr:phosphoglycerate dehydrogenase [Aureococcus anophagefferens]
MYRRVALTATVACGALLIGHLKRKFRRNACAAVRVFIHQLQKARHETLKAFLQPYAGVPDVVAKALRRERRRRNVNDLTPLVCCNSHHNAPMTAELAVALAAAKRLCVADERLRRGDWRARACPRRRRATGARAPAPADAGREEGPRRGLGAAGSAGRAAALGARVSATSRSCSASRRRRSPAAPRRRW